VQELRELRHGQQAVQEAHPKLRKLIEKPKVIESALGPAEVVTDFSASDCSDTEPDSDSDDEPDSDDDTLPQRTDSDTPLERRHARLRFLRVNGLFDHRLHGGYSANAALAEV
jgi:hypothetical protein